MQIEFSSMPASVQVSPKAIKNSYTVPPPRLSARSTIFHLDKERADSMKYRHADDGEEGIYH